MTIHSRLFNDPYEMGVRNLDTVSDVCKRLKDLDFYTEIENKQAYNQLLLYFETSPDSRIDPDFYQVFGIAACQSSLRLCKNAQVLALNGAEGKSYLEVIKHGDIVLSLSEMKKSPTDLFKLRSIRWYLYASYYLMKSKAELEHLRQVAELGFACVGTALFEGGHWEVIQFYLTVMLFSEREDLKNKITPLLTHLNSTSKSAVMELLLQREALDLARRPLSIPEGLTPLERFHAVSQAYEERKNKLSDLIERVKDVGHASHFLRSDIKLQVKTAVLELYTTSWIVGLRPNFNFREYLSIFSIESANTKHPSNLNVRALDSALRCYSVLNMTKEMTETKEALILLAARV